MKEDAADVSYSPNLIEVFYKKKISKMALNFKNVERAYEVFNEIKKTVLPELRIDSFPEDISEWYKDDMPYPNLNQVYGFDKKPDGWESIVFFVRNPSSELKLKFDELKSKISNSSISRPYSKNSEIWIFGWF